MPIECSSCGVFILIHGDGGGLESKQIPSQGVSLAAISWLLRATGLSDRRRKSSHVISSKMESLLATCKNGNSQDFPHMLGMFNRIAGRGGGGGGTVAVGPTGRLRDSEVLDKQRPILPENQVMKPVTARCQMSQCQQRLKVLFLSLFFYIIPSFALSVFLYFFLPSFLPSFHCT